MAWIRRVRTKSGATAVQLAESVGGRRRIVRHVGSAHDEAALGLLMAEASRLLSGDLQQEFDLGVTLPVAYTPMLGSPSQPALIDRSGPQRKYPVAVPQVLKTCSDVLFDVIAGVWSDLGFDVLDDLVFRDLVIARVVEPTSLLDVDRVLTDLGCVAASLSTRKRALGRCRDHGYRDQLAALCFAHASSYSDLSVVLYDVTTLRTQADKEDDLRRVGYSKDRSVDPQVTVGLLVDRAGFPLEIGCFKGNQAEKHTILPIVDLFKDRHNLNSLPVVVADAGMLSAGNLKVLDDKGYQFIVGSRAGKAPIDLESHFRWHGDVFDDGQLIDTLTPKTGKNQDNNPSVKAEPVWDRDIHSGSWRAIWVYSAKRFTRDNHTLTAQENRAKEVIGGVKTARKPRFVKATAAGYSLDKNALERARRLAGLKGYVTNIPATQMPPAEIIAHYHDLWHVEESFRISKSDLAARPFFARKRDAIEAHLTIVFTALAISRTIQQRTGISIRRVIRTLRPLRSATIHINGITQTIPPAINPDQETLINAIKTQPSSRH